MGHHAVNPDLAALGAQSHNESLDAARNVAAVQAAALAEHAPLVVVDRHPAGLVNEVRQLFAVEHGQALAGIKNKRNRSRLELCGMQQHGITPVRRNNAQLDVAAGLDFAGVRMAHGAGVKGGDLVVIAVRHDHGLGGVAAGDLSDELGADALVAKVRHIVLAVVAYGGHWQG